MGALPRLYARIACRQIQTSAARRYEPVPTVRREYGSELAALQAKEKGPWTELTKQEKIDCKSSDLICCNCDHTVLLFEVLLYC